MNRVSAPCAALAAYFSYTLYEVKYVRNATAKCSDCHSIHRLCVDAVVPDKTPEHLSQRPLLIIASEIDGIL